MTRGHESIFFQTTGLALGMFFELVEEGKFSYFGLARNLIRHLISPNQDDLSYLSRTFISGHQIG